MSELIGVTTLQKMINHAVPEESGILLDNSWKVPGELLDTRYAVLKFKPYSICEVLAYQLANYIGIRVPHFKGIWTRDPIKVNRNETSGLFRVGILIEYLNNIRRISWERAVERDPVMVAKILVLCIFDRLEWGELIEFDGNIYFIDLVLRQSPNDG